ncbi:fumarylacetoacetate hydrolase family protein [Frankia sp. CNm7]|uniref:Fumarylacetoacetate hydrolase family protein n=1 Tax=Frankia nepalensis TaxID=1836974 RepID=A0A937RV60_9ACTN|nr:fumarylacetoacetate hydrolase family protein [Frankia nepalensis]MBL7501960.1 fumarylacetoacetate hydrolase family protein [Frankia nepalensis]MBL7510590.1 fumarylacetoacetate hydrolase family protein [Frankia nepalensis]MBL7517330.1 fumarylacetoacetate hydrolase family protein [Frankia nepalensis]MBL7633413.1 fumarylacetoacetate hydrolase family protein [Frankia nepalensis]
MRIANLAGRAVLLTGDGAVDIHKASGGALSSDPQALFEGWQDAWPVLAALTGEASAYEDSDLRAPVPRPGQIFAIGVNYRDHAQESGIDIASLTFPMTFTKFASCLTGPFATVTLPEGWVDWEVELVVVIGKGGHHVAARDAWEHVAGYTIGQDLSERLGQWSGPAPQQFSLGKSHPGFGPTGPAVVTLDELPDPADLAIGCAVGSETMQDGRTGGMIFDVPELIAHLSSVAVLQPGDLIFTGTPAGIGATRSPSRFLADGDELVSTIEGLGTQRVTFRTA